MQTIFQLKASNPRSSGGKTWDGKGSWVEGSDFRAIKRRGLHKGTNTRNLRRHCRGTSCNVAVFPGCFEVHLTNKNCLHLTCTV